MSHFVYPDSLAKTVFAFNRVISVLFNDDRKKITFWGIYNVFFELDLRYEYYLDNVKTLI